MLVSHLSNKVELDEAVSNQRGLGAPVIEGHYGVFVLALEGTPDVEVEVVVVQEFVDHWAEHVREDVLADEEHGVANHDEGKLKHLEEAEGGERVLVVNEGVSESELGVVDDWVDVAVLVQLHVHIEGDVEVLDDQSHWSISCHDPSVNCLNSINFPLLNSWELELNEWHVVNLVFSHVNFEVIEIP